MKPIRVNASTAERTANKKHPLRKLSSEAAGGGTLGGERYTVLQEGIVRRTCTKER
jgi:hypothetical protein